ncbi:MAG: SRPBCC family protein [Thermoleophilaceae bacterium]
MSAWREQVVIDAPVEVVWGLVGDPSRYPEWAQDVLEVTGVPELEPGATYRQKTRLPIGSTTTTFVVDDFEELREIRLHCTQSGYYSRWLLTEAQEATFADVELGMEPIKLPYRAVDAFTGKRGYRRMLQRSLDGLKEVADRERSG